MSLDLWSFNAGVGGADLRGMSVEALDGSVGEVQDVIDRIGGAYLIVDTGRWIFGKTVVVPAGVVTAVDHDRRCVFISRSQDDVKNAPEHDPNADDDVRETLGAYYDTVRRGDQRAESDSAMEPGSGAAAVPHVFGDAAPTETEPVPPSGGGEHTAGPTAPFGGSTQSEEQSLGRSRPLAPPASEYGGGGSDALAPGRTGAAATPGEGDATSQPSDAVASNQPTDLSAGFKRPPADTAPASGSTPSERQSSAAADVAQQDDEPAQGSTATAPEATRPQAGAERTSSNDTEAPSGRAHEASASLGQEGSGRAEQADATGRFAGDSGPSASTSRSTSPSGGQSRRNDASGASSPAPPIARYDSLTAAEVIARLRNLSQHELGELERYEKRHEGRQTVLSRIDSLREDEPWRGYDDATVPEITKELADADEDRAKAVRDYERRHRDRKGVMEAARRTVSSA